MKARNILITIGSILIILNLFSYLSPDEPHALDNSVAYWIGYNFMFIIGFTLLIIAFFKHKAVLRKRRKEMVDSLLK